jgi:threonyl-tRNA synthetase
MLHRALFGSIERFFGVLLEHYAGAFPTWLAPVQVRVLPVRDDHQSYAEEVVGELALWASASTGRRRREAGQPHPQGQGREDPLRAGGGRRRRPARTVGVNPRGGEVDRGVDLDTFAQRILDEVDDQIHLAR